MTEISERGWREALGGEFETEYYRQLREFVDGEYQSRTVYPPEDLIFDAFERTPFDSVKVVILGQDPYHEPGEAQGLAFYVPPEVKVPPSLANISKELAEEYSQLYAVPNLRSWAAQGVLLLNATLTVRGGHDGAMSHSGKGWEKFTDAAVRALAESKEHLVFLLWGAHAQKKGASIDRTRHLVLESVHPSPLSAYRGFFGCGHFRKANEYLAAHSIEPIDWLRGEVR